MGKGIAYLNSFHRTISFKTGSFQIHYWGDAKKHFNNHEHRHSFWEAVLIISGEGEYIENQQVYPLQNGALFLTKPKTMHQIKSKYGMKLFYIGFQLEPQFASKEWREYLNHIFKNLNTIKYLAKDNILLSEWSRLYDTAAQQEQILFTEKINLLSQQVLFEVLDQFHFSAEARSETERSISSNNKNDFSNIKQFMIDNIQSELHLDEVAEIFYISTRQLSRLFKENEQITFTEYRKKIRIEKALELLKEKELTITEISALSGFSSVQYFSATFSKYMNLSPNSYREKYLS